MRRATLPNAGADTADLEGEGLADEARELAERDEDDERHHLCLPCCRACYRCCSVFCSSFGMEERRQEVLRLFLAALDAARRFGG